MTGVEAIISIVDVAGRVGFRLAQFLHDVNEAEETRNTLYTKVAELEGIVRTVKTTVKARDQNSQEPISEEEDAIRSLLLRAMCQCERTVQKFGEQIGWLGNVERRSRWWKSVALQIRLDVHGSTLARTERDIQADIASLQLLYTCFLPFEQEQRLTALHINNERTNEYLSKLQQEVEKQTVVLEMMSLRPPPPQTSQGRAAFSERPHSIDERSIQDCAHDDGPDTQIMEESLEKARSLIEAISTHGSIVGQERGSGTTQHGSSHDEPSEELHSRDERKLEAGFYDQGLPGDSQGCLPQDVMIKFLDNYSNQAREDLRANHFDRAKFNLLKAMKLGNEREEAYKWPFEAKFDIGIQLSVAYTGLKQFDEAERILRSMLPWARRHPLKNSELYYSIARVHCARYEKTKSIEDLDRLHRSAKSSYDLAWSSDSIENPFLGQTADIMYQLYKWEQDFVAAETIRELHPLHPVSTSSLSPTATRLKVGNLSRIVTNAQDKNPETQSLSEASSPNAAPLLSSTEGSHPTGFLSSAPTSLDSMSRRSDVSTTLFTRAQAGNVLEVTQMIANGENVEHTNDKSGLTPLLVAAKYKRTKVCEVLLTNDISKANIRAQDIEGRTALHFAVSGFGGEDLIPLLLRSEAKLNKQDKLGRTPLHACADYGNHGAARTLLRKGAKWEIVDKAGQTALYIAIKNRNQPMVEEFLRCGAMIGEEDMPPTSEGITWIIEEKRGRLSMPDSAPALSRKVSIRKTFSNQTTITENSKRTTRRPSIFKSKR